MYHRQCYADLKLIFQKRIQISHRDSQKRRQMIERRKLKYENPSRPYPFGGGGRGK